MYELLVLLILVVAIVMVTARFKISPFLALIGAAILAAFAYRIPLAEVASTVTTAFGSTMGNIGSVHPFRHDDRRHSGENPVLRSPWQMH